MSNSHHAHVYRTLESFLKYCAGPNDGSESFKRRVRSWTAKWNKYVEKHGNVPLIVKCNICSGKERKEEIKTGMFKVSTRNEKKLLKEELSED